MADKSPPVAISVCNDVRTGLLDIAWDDGEQHSFAHAGLRAACRCADCVCDPALQRVRDPDIRIVDIRPVGAYGIQLVFSDGHERGIYPWSYLRSLASDPE